MTARTGPTGGRHVWVALSQPAAPDVARLARALARLLPSLDTAPLANPRTGALRPPGAPHRLTGASQVLAGRPAGLLAATATTAQLLTLAGLVEQAAPDSAGTSASRAVGRDAAGHPHLLGEHRPLPRAARAALDRPMPAEADASAVLATVLAGAHPAGPRSPGPGQHRQLGLPAAAAARRAAPDRQAVAPAPRVVHHRRPHRAAASRLGWQGAPAPAAGCPSGSRRAAGG